MSESIAHYRVFALDERVYTIADLDLANYNRKVVETLEPKWFLEAAGAHADDESDEALDRLPNGPALAVRLTYHHALETFLAFLFAAYQAPEALPGWLRLYQARDLKALITKVNRGDVVLNNWGMPRTSWQTLARLFFGCPFGPVNEVHARAVDGWASAWNRLANDFADDRHRDEYNSTKHGFRAQPGGVSLKFRSESEAAPPPTVWGHNHGTWTFDLEPIPGRDSSRGRHFSLVNRSVPWGVPQTVRKLKLLVLSLLNLKTTLARVHGLDGDWQFHHFEDGNEYLRPWGESTSMRSMQFRAGEVGTVSDYPTKDRMLSMMREASGISERSSAS